MKAKRFLELNVSVASEWAETIDGGARINRKQWNCFSSIGYLASNPSYFVLLVWIHFHMCYKLAAIKMDLICFPVLAIPVMPQAYRMSASENSYVFWWQRGRKKRIFLNWRQSSGLLVCLTSCTSRVERLGFQCKAWCVPWLWVLEIRAGFLSLLFAFQEFFISCEISISVSNNKKIIIKTLQASMFNSKHHVYRCTIKVWNFLFQYYGTFLLFLSDV